MARTGGWTKPRGNRNHTASRLTKLIRIIMNDDGVGRDSREWPLFASQSIFLARPSPKDIGVAFIRHKANESAIGARTRAHMHDQCKYTAYKARESCE